MNTLSRLSKKIEKANELFASMSKEQKIVTIAQDCIARIKLNQFKLKKGSFFKNQEDLGSDLDSVKELLNGRIYEREIVQCQVCAKGGLFLSYVGRVNDVRICDISNNNSSSDRDHKKLLEIFSLDQLSLIEFAFEGKFYLYGHNISKVEIERATKFFLRYGGEYGEYEIPRNKSSYDVDKRMLAICRNIIRNEGVFKP